MARIEQARKGRRVFERIDLRQVRVRLRVDETSIEGGRRNLPPETDRSLDGNQAEIVQYFSALIDKARTLVIKETQATLMKMEELAGQLRARPFVQECSDQPSHFRDRLSRLEADHRDRLVRPRLAERKLDRDIKYFRLKNELHREAHYPESRIFHWAIIIAMIVLESLGNAYFFAEGSSLGFAGGWLQSIVVSLLVILSSAKLIGARTVPLLNHIRPRWKVIGGFVLALYVALLFLFCLLVAHYRLLLAIDPDHALAQTLPHLLARPFELDPVSWMFFGVSMMFGISAVIAGYTSDDSYPGYGALDRRHKDAEREYDRTKDEVTAATNSVYDDISTTINRIVSDAKDLLHQHETQLPRIRSLHADYNAYASTIEDECKVLLKAYRDRNRQVRTAPAPQYFNDDVSFNDQIALGVPDLSGAEGMSTAFQQTLTTLMETATRVRAELQTIASDRRTKLREFIDAVEASALTRLGEDSRLPQ